MKLIVSGSGGSLGIELLNILSKKNTINSVIALDMKIDNIIYYANKPKFTLLTNEEFLKANLDLSCYTLINLAYARRNDFELIKSSCEWTFALLRKLESNGSKRYVNISSQSVYDPHRRSPAKESDLPMVSEPYDMGKYYLENWIREFALKHDSHFMNLRLSSLAGPNYPQRITSKLVKKALADNEIFIDMNGQIFSYTHVVDTAHALLAAAELEDDLDWNLAYNVGSKESYTIENIAQCIEDLFTMNNLDLKINRVPAEANNVNSAIDSSLFQNATNWAAEYNLCDIIKEEFMRS